MSALENVCEHFKARKSGRQWVARCPAHEDKSPSMWLTEGDDGRVLFGCRAGCRNEDIVAASGLPWQAFFARSPVFVAKRVNRKSESSSRPFTREELERDWDDGLLSHDEYLRLLDLWHLGLPDLPRSRVEIKFDEHGEVTHYKLRPKSLGMPR